MTGTTPNPKVEAVCATLGYHQEHPVTGKLVLRNPDGPEAATLLREQERQLASIQPTIEAYREALERIAAPMPGISWAATERQEIARAALSSPTKEGR